MRTRSVVIVGAGPGGLACAMLLAAAGCRVTVLERDAAPGGRTSTLHSGGFRFDRGPTFFLYPEVLRSVFRMCGRELDREVELTRLDPNYRLVFEQGGSLEATSDLAKLKREIARLSPEDADRLDGYLDDNRHKFAAFRSVLESSFGSHLDLLKLPWHELLPLLRPHKSVDADLAAHFSDPRVRLAMSFQSKYLGMSPFKCPSLFTILAFLEHEFGVFHPRGGCGALSEAMYRIAKDMGVDFEFSSPVEGIEFDGRRATAALTRAGRHSCDALVINADFANAMRQLVPNQLRRRWTNRRIAAKKMSCSTFMLYLGVEGRYEDVAHHTILISRNYEQNLREIDELHRLPSDPSVYVHNPSVIDDSLAPPGMSSLYVLAPVSNLQGDTNWSSTAPAFRTRVLDQLAKVGMQDIRDRIRVEKIVTPESWATDLNLYKGATFSLAHTLGQMLSFRPRNRFEDLEGVYLVGGGTHPGSGLPVIYQSAKNSAKLVARDLGLQTSWEAPRSRSVSERPVLVEEGV